MRLVVTLCLLLPLATAQGGKPKRQLPRVLLIGDSITLGYAPHVRALLSGTAGVHCVPDNGGHTAMGLAALPKWLDPAHGAWDVIHFNFGLWDLAFRRRDDDPKQRIPGAPTHTAEQYASNLKAIVARLQQTGADLVFATTTPAPEALIGREGGDPAAYNAAALPVMREAGVWIDDLHRLAAPRMQELAADDDVHFSETGSRALATQVARAIRRALDQRVAGKRSKGAPAPQWTPDETVVYRETPQGALRLHVFRPPHAAATDRRPGIVFFFGGGWNGGTPKQFYPHCDYLAGRGMVAISAEYRVKSRHETTPFECVEDGKAALRWVRAHAAELGIDPARIAAGGGSAGGHVAAAVATVPGLEPQGATPSCRPDALVLFNPVYDNGPKGYGNKRLGDRWKELSPMHNLRAGVPPAIVFLGTEDNLIPVATGTAFQAEMRAAGSRSELCLYEGRGHGFFNHGRGSGADYRATVRAMDAFLGSLGFLEGAPTVRP